MRAEDLECVVQPAFHARPPLVRTNSGPLQGVNRNAAVSTAGEPGRLRLPGAQAPFSIALRCEVIPGLARKLLMGCIFRIQLELP